LAIRLFFAFVSRLFRETIYTARRIGNWARRIFQYTRDDFQSARDKF
jgi:hypothetical protein